MASNKDCIKIIRLEMGLRELAEGLVATLSGRQVAPGSVVLMTLATNMAIGGTSGFVENLLGAIKYLRANLGDHLHYGLIPNLFINGCSDGMVLRTNKEVNTFSWLGSN
jgi:hypothetical protein